MPADGLKLKAFVQGGCPGLLFCLFVSMGPHMSGFWGAGPGRGAAGGGFAGMDSGIQLWKEGVRATAGCRWPCEGRLVSQYGGCWAYPDRTPAKRHATNKSTIELQEITAPNQVLPRRTLPPWPYKTQLQRCKVAVLGR